MATEARTGGDSLFSASLYAAVGRAAWRFVGIAVAAWIVTYALIRLRLVVLPVITAGFATALLAPAVAYLRRRGWPSMAATWAVMVVAIGLLVGLVLVLAPSIGDQFDDVGQDVKAGAEKALDWLTTGPLDLTERQVDNAIDQISNSLAENQGRVIGGVLAGVTLAIEVVLGLLIALVLLFFFLKDGPLIADWLADLVPERNRAHARELGRRLGTTMTGYLRGVAIIGLVDATLIGIVLLIVGVPLVLPLAVLTFFGAFLPLVGATMAGIVAVLVALVSNGFTQALIVAVAVIVIQEVEGDVLQPVVMGRSVRLHPIAVLLALTTGAAIGGFIGAFLAVPVAAVLATWSGYLRGVVAEGKAVVAGDTGVTQ